MEHNFRLYKDRCFQTCCNLILQVSKYTLVLLLLIFIINNLSAAIRNVKLGGNVTAYHSQQLLAIYKP